MTCVLGENKRIVCYHWYLVFLSQSLQLNHKEMIPHCHQKDMVSGCRAIVVCMTTSTISKCVVYIQLKHHLSISICISPCKLIEERTTKRTDLIEKDITALLVLPVKDNVS